jgi:hypothetical protein
MALIPLSLTSHAFSVLIYLTPRLPRRCRARSFLVGAERLRICSLASQMIPGKPFPDNLTYSQIKALSVIHALSVVIAERLLIEVPASVNTQNRPYMIT